MNPNHLTRTKIETIVERKIEEMTEDPIPVLRELLKFSRHFSHSRFQTPVCSLIQYLLANEDSQYYALIQQLLSNTSHATIKNIGINLGYNSWTQGAQSIRAASQKSGYSIPWNIIFRWNPSDPSLMSLKNIHELIQEANRIGVFSFCIRQEISDSSYSDIFRLFSAHPDSTFFWFLPDMALSDSYLTAIPECENMIPLFNSQSPHIYDITCYLHKKNALYGISHTYNHSDQIYKKSGQWVHYYKMYNTPLIITIPEDSCDQKVRDEAASYISTKRKQQQFPYIVIDLYSDIRRISQLISGEKSYMEIGSDGQIIYPTDSDILHQDHPDLKSYLASSSNISPNTFTSNV